MKLTPVEATGKAAGLSRGWLLFGLGGLASLDAAAFGRWRTLAVALLCLGGFAHQTLSVTVITMSSDLFKRNEVATVAGLAGTCGNAGVLVFNLLIGVMVVKIGYAPFFIGLGVLACVIVAGLYGAATVNRRILLVQALPAAIAMVLIWLA